MRRGVILLAWWFMTAATLPGGSVGITTQGPFQTEIGCKAAMAWARSLANPGARLAVYECWSDGR